MRRSLADRSSRSYPCGMRFMCQVWIEKTLGVDTYVGVRRGDRAAQASVCCRRHLVIHIVPVTHVVASAGAILNVAAQLELELPGRLHERDEGDGRAPRRARASARFECGPGPGAGRTCATPPASPPPSRRAPPYTAAASVTRRRWRGPWNGPRILRPTSCRPRRPRRVAARRA